MPEVYILFGASVAVAFFAIVTFFVVLSYHRALGEKKKLEEELSQIKVGRGASLDQIMLTAQNQAREIIKNAELKSQEVVRSSEIFSLEFKKNFQTGLLELLELEKSLYRQTATDVQQESNRTLLKMSEVLNGQLDNEMKAFHGAMVDETTRTRDSLNKSIREVYQNAQTEVQNYKSQMMARVNSAVFAIVQDASKKSLGVILTKEQHEKAILKALEEAKAKNVF